MKLNYPALILYLSTVAACGYLLHHTGVLYGHPLMAAAAIVAVWLIIGLVIEKFPIVDKS